jgi:hypothetical protein
MRYKLTEGGGAGAITDPTPVLRDIRDTFEVSFGLPDAGAAYVALFTGADGTEYKSVIRDGAVKVPKELLAKEQTVGLTVCQLGDGRILRSWECPPLQIGALLYMRQGQRRLGADTGADAAKRLEALEEQVRRHEEALSEVKRYVQEQKDLSSII